MVAQIITKEDLDEPNKWLKSYPVKNMLGLMLIMMVRNLRKMANPYFQSSSSTGLPRTGSELVVRDEQARLEQILNEQVPGEQTANKFAMNKLPENKFTANEFAMNECQENKLSMNTFTRNKLFTPSI